MSAARLGLSEWLDRLQQLHPHEIELGLERVGEVAQRLALDLSSCQVVTVAGTNGKGSTVAALQQIALRHGWSVGSYTSPHLLRFNERLQIDGVPVADDILCSAFARVEAHRGDVPLTYFEFTTLAVLFCLQQYQPHLCLLEVGLGGRLDAVNIIDADITVVTNIQLDHQQFLGHDRETIALEKAGIFRPGVPAICAEYQAPSNLRRAAREVGAHWFQLGHDFDLELEVDRQGASQWRWRGVNVNGGALEFAATGSPSLERSAVAAALQTACLLLPDPHPRTLVAAAAEAELPGRCQLTALDGVPVLLDVAHNGAAMQRLRRFAEAHPAGGRTHLVLALMRDKPAREMIAALSALVDGDWYLPALAIDRAYPVTELLPLVAHPARTASSVAVALAEVCARAQPGDRVLVTGSFVTVADALLFIQEGGDGS